LPNSKRTEQPLALRQQAVHDGARLLPCFSSRVMLARDEAVSAVSLPARTPTAATTRTR